MHSRQSTRRKPRSEDHINCQQSRRSDVLKLRTWRLRCKPRRKWSAGSTRMGAGTAQKIALNLLSTLMAVHLGHVHDGYMVNLIADNIKLRERAARIVSAISACDIGDAAKLLEASGGSVKSAILLAAGAHKCRTSNRNSRKQSTEASPGAFEIERGSARSPGSR